MTWNPDKDGIAYSQLNKELRNRIDNMVNIDQYRSLSNEINTHFINTVTHVSVSDRNNWNYAYKRIVEYVDGDISNNLNDMAGISRQLQNHMNDNVRHWTDVDKNMYENFVTETKDGFDALNKEIRDINVKFDNYITQSVFQTHVSEFNNHVLNLYTHVRDDERSKWNSSEGNAKRYADEILYIHTSNSDMHIKAAEREKWNDHVENDSVHITAEDKSKFNSHISNAGLHVSTDQKMAWDRALNEITDLKARVEALERRQ